MAVPSLFSQYLRLKSKAALKKDKIADFISSGIALSNQACYEWFAAHNLQYEDLQNEQSVWSVVGDTVLAAMGVGGERANIMGYTAILFGSVNSGYEAFESNFFLTSTIWKLEKGVREARKKLAVNIEKKSTGEIPYSYLQAVDTLLSYHQTCPRLQLLTRQSSFSFIMLK